MSSKVWLYGTYQNALVVASQEWVDQCLDRLTRINRVAKAVNEAKCWDDVLKELPIQEIESLVSPSLDAAFGTSSHQMDPIPENDGEDREFGQLPPFEYCQRHMEWWQSTPCLDDADMIRLTLPEEVMELTARPVVSPMTDYTPCNWFDTDLPKLMDLADKYGAVLTEANAVFARVERMWLET